MTRALTVVLAAVVWLAGGTAASAQEADPVDLSAAIPITVAAHYAPWFTTPGDAGWTNWVGTTPVHPAYFPTLGYYDNRSPSTLTQHVAWAKAYGIDAFMIEWCGLPGGAFPAGFDQVVRLFPANPSFSQIKFFFVYSLIQALRKNGEPDFPIINLSDPQRLGKFVSDMRYAARTYFKRPNHLRVGSRPVVYLWATPNTKGNFAAAILKVRAAIKAECGADPFILGDTLSYGSMPDLVRTPTFDAVMPYVMVKVPSPLRNYTIDSLVGDIGAQYQGARNACLDLKVKFVPAVFPGFNAVGAPWCYNRSTGRLAVPTVARSTTGFTRLAQTARQTIDPDLRMLLVTSWSEWNEGTNIEPARQFGSNYLNVVKTNLTAFTPVPFPKYTVKFAFKQVQKIGADERLLAAAFDLVEFLNASGQVVRRLDIGAASARPSMGIGFFADEKGLPGATNFCWAGERLKYATVHVDPPPGAVAVRFRMLQIKDQTVEVFVNGVRKASLPASTPWTWVTYKVGIS